MERETPKILLKLLQRLIIHESDITQGEALAIADLTESLPNKEVTNKLPQVNTNTGTAEDFAKNWLKDVTPYLEQDEKEGLYLIDHDYLHSICGKIAEQYKSSLAKPAATGDVKKQRELLIAYAKLENGNDILYDTDIEKIDKLLSNTNQ